MQNIKHESPDTPKTGVTLIDVACVFAVLSVVGWELVPYLLAIGAGLAILIVCVAGIIGLVRLVPFLLRRRQVEERLCD